MVEPVDTPEQMWEKFIKRLNEVQPIRGAKREDPSMPHKIFLGSIVVYKRIFLEANKEQ